MNAGRIPASLGSPGASLPYLPRRTNDPPWSPDSTPSFPHGSLVLDTVSPLPPMTDSPQPLKPQGQTSSFRHRLSEGQLERVRTNKRKGSMLGHEVMF